jgi:AcrR family transcriptional regulator
MPPRHELSRLRRAQILDAAVKIIIERGLAETRIADVAQRAGASPALVVYHFGTRDRLLAQALVFSEERFYTTVEQQLSEIESATGQLTKLIEASCSPGWPDGRQTPDGYDEWVLWLDLWARAPRDPEVARYREQLDRRWRETIARIVRAGQETGEFSTVDPEDFALRLAALVDGLAVQVTLGDPDVPATRMLEVCMRTAAGELGFDWNPPAARHPGSRSGSRSSRRGQTPRTTREQQEEAGA